MKIMRNSGKVELTPESMIRNSSGVSSTVEFKV